MSKNLLNSMPEAPMPEAPMPEAPMPEAPMPEAPMPEAPMPEAPMPEAPMPEAPMPEYICPTDNNDIVDDDYSGKVKIKEASIMEELWFGWVMFFVFFPIAGYCFYKGKHKKSLIAWCIELPFVIYAIGGIYFI